MIASGISGCTATAALTTGITFAADQISVSTSQATFFSWGANQVASSIATSAFSTWPQNTYAAFFLNSLSSVVQLDCLEISHSLFSQTYFVVRNATNGVTVTHEDGTANAYAYYPLKCTLSGVRDDLDHILKVEFGDLGELIPAEIDAIRSSDGFDEYPVVRYRTYRSDDLTTPLYGPILLHVKNFQFTREGAFFEAKAPSLNVNRTGEIYKIARFPMLKGLL